MRKYHNCVITKVAKPNDAYKLDEVEFIDTSLDNLVDACKNGVTALNQKFALRVFCYGGYIPESGRYSIEMTILLTKSGALFAHNIKVKNADFHFSHPTFHNGVTEVTAEITIMPLPTDDTACSIVERAD